MKPDIHLRRATLNDVDTLDAIEHACFEEPLRFPRSMIAGLLERDLGWLAFHGEAPAAFLLASLRTVGKRRVGYIDTVETLPDHRRLGLAELLLTEAEELFLNKGCAAVVLHVAVDNTAAQALYTRHGYHQGERVAEFYPDGTDALLLLRPL